ncbi:MAG TPA: glycoside hydrolase family 15 protein [Solirubrobacterales bacterium]|nr:glycoside hydrolase family 15 protein [Solirubrobacterales bacterium]
MPSLQSRYPRISSYGFLSDCHTGALVSPEGSVEWLCLPRFDSKSVFGSLLDRSAGFWRLGPPGLVAPVSRRYEPGTNVIETTWMTGSGWIVVHDMLTVGDWRQENDFEPHRRPPPDDEAEHVLVRIVECVQGEVDVEMICQPAFDYGKTRLDWLRRGDSGTDAELGTEDIHLILTGDLALGVDGSDARARHRMKTGEKRFSALSWGPSPIPPDSVEDCERRMARTVDFWRRWLEAGSFPDHPWSGHLQRSALTLKGLTHSPTGALIAALTTSLPESPGGERNWDYRFTWIRDATFALWAMHTLGFDYEATDFMGWMADIYRDNVSQGKLGMQIMYGIGGERDLREITLDHLTGYEGAKPVRVGNAACKQRQNDVYGALLDSVYIHAKVQDHLPHELWEALCQQVEAAAAVWDEPDHGIWEGRGDPKHYVSSKLMCWVALDRGCRLADRIGDENRLVRWSKVAHEIRADILERGVSEHGVFRQHYDTDALDASTLLIPLVRFLPPDDERVHNTVTAIAMGLTEDGLVLRYRVEETDDGLHGEESTFTICSFWLVAALSEIGERDAAREMCEKLLPLCGPLGLYAEELDPKTGRHWGNFPQAFTHLALINAVSHVIADDRATPDRNVTGVLSEMIAQQG